MTTRGDYQRVAVQRLRDAQVLFAGRRYSAAYYMAGYSVECAIKVILAARFLRHTVPTKQLVNDIYEHNLEKLMGNAKLSKELKTETEHNPAFLRNWNVVKNWEVETRYAPRRSPAEARDMLDAVADPTDGILVWIQRYW